jgi:hypothetical protein
MGAAFRLGPKGLLLPGRLPPAEGLQVDWSHPLAHRLQCCAMPDGAGNVIDLAKPRGGSGANGALRPRGAAVASATIDTAATADINFTTAPFSYAAVGFLATVALNFASLFGRLNYVDSTHCQGWLLQYSQSGALRSYILNNNDDQGLSTTGVSATAGTTWTVGATADGTTHRLYINGTQNNFSTSVSQQAASASTPLQCGHASGGTSLFEMHIGCAWSRTLTPAEMLQFHHDPLCMLTPALPVPAAYWPGDAFSPGRMFAIFPP